MTVYPESLSKARLRPPPPLASVLLAILSVQFGAAFAKQLFAIAGPLWTGALRICFAAMMLAVAFRPKLAGLRREQWQAAIPYGISLACMNLVFYFAVDRMPLGLAVAIEFTGPLVVALVGSQRLLDLVWALLAVCGILLITPWSRSQAVDGYGLLLALCAGMAWAAYILLGRRVSCVFEGSMGVAVGMITAAVAMLPTLAFGARSIPLTTHVLLGALGVALLCSALPYSLEMIALRVMPARTFGILMSLEPAVAALCGWIVLRESLKPLQLTAIALIIAASAGTTISAKRFAAPVEV